jgi:hypothetical protein
VNQLERRLGRLEQRLSIKPGARIIYFTPNLEADEPEESPYLVKLSSEVWAHVSGPGLSRIEIEMLKKEFSSSK